jgi:hypothetical protein
MCREVPWGWPDPRYHRRPWTAFGAICRPDHQAPPGTTSPTRDLIGAWRKAHRSAVRGPAGACRPASHTTRKGRHGGHATPQRLVTVGVDSHKDIHVAAAVDQLGRLLGTLRRQPPARLRPAPAVGAGAWPGGALRDRGHRQLRRRAGPLAGRPRPPGRRGQPAQPATRRGRGKSDPADAKAAARSALAGGEVTTPRRPTAPWRCCGCCGSRAARR